jgi:hypothetical protein
VCLLAKVLRTSEWRPSLHDPHTCTTQNSQKRSRYQDELEIYTSCRLCVIFQEAAEKKIGITVSDDEPSRVTTIDASSAISVA